MNNIVFGKYLPLNTVIHNLDPRAKIIAMFFVLIAVFLPAGFIGYGIIALALASVIILAKINFRFIIKAFKPMMFMMIFLLVINILSYKDGTLLLSFGFISVYSSALIQTLYIVIRLILMIMTTTILTFTTKPLDLTLGIEYMLTPLKRFNFPAHEIAMIISIALRFIPTIIEETARIMNSQKSRGVDFEEGKLKEKVVAIVSLIVPLFSVAFQRADDLADAMEARGYVPGANRTRYKQLCYHQSDYVLMVSAFILLACMIAISIIL